MGKKKLIFASFLFKHGNTKKPSRYLSSPPPLWPWPSCKQPKTDSFRDADAVRRTVNSVCLDSVESCFTRSPTSDEPDQSLTTASEDDSVEMVVRGLRSADRLFSRPGGDTSSILGEAKEAAGEDLPFEGSVALALESDDPQADFRRSMEEVVAAHGVRDWKRLEALLVWYLRANGKKTHEFIFEAFVDLLVGLAYPNSPLSSSSSSSSSSSTASIEIVEIKEDEGILIN